jgi:molybdopterin-guanine dinucleotide biosynthesis protein A
MIGHVLRAIHNCVEQVRVVGRERQHPDEVIPTEFRETTKFVADAFPDLGPLEGFRAGLESLPDSIRFVFLSGCDSPLITPKFIEFLFQTADGYEAAVPWIDGKLCPLPAVYQRTAALDCIEEMRAPRERSLWRLVERLQTQRVTREELEQVDPGLEALINVNDAPTLDTVAAIFSQRRPMSG